MTDPWDERTEAIPGVRAGRSIELDHAFEADLARAATDGAAAAVVPPSPMGFLEDASLLVFDPSHLGVAAALERNGYAVTSVATAVDVMSSVAARAPAAVVCAPSPEPERRRMLSAALRLRFPAIPVLYVSTHAGQEEAVLGAMREGARAVLAWPLPAPSDVKRVFAPYLAPRGASQARGARGKGDVETSPIERARPPGRDDDDDLPTVRRPHFEPTAPGGNDTSGFDDVATAVLPPASQAVGTRVPPNPFVPPPKPHATPPAHVEELPSDALKPLPVELPPPPQAEAEPADSSEPRTAPGRYRPEVRGQIGELLDAVSPFLWGLEDAARWVDAQGARGDPEAQTHGRTLRMLKLILEQLRDRIDETGA